MNNLKYCYFDNTTLCFTERDKRCIYPETMYDCTRCVISARLINGVCKCNSGYIGPGYIECVNENQEGKLTFYFFDK